MTATGMGQTRTRKASEFGSTGVDEDVRVSTEYRLRRRLRRLGQLRQPQNVLELLAAAKGRGGVISLQAFNAAIAAVAACEGGYRHTLTLMVLMEEERVAPDRFTLTAIVASCCRSQQWDVAHRVLLEMQRCGLRPLDMRPSRLTTAPGEDGEARDKVLHLLECLRSTPSTEQPRPTNWTSAEGQLFQKQSGGGGIDTHRETGLARQAGYGGSASSPGDVSRTGDADERSTVHDDTVRVSMKGLPRGEVVASTTVGPEGSQGVGDDRALDELLAEGVRPGPGVFLSELKAAAIAKNYVRGLKLLDSMRNAGYPPHQGAYACAIRACGRAGKWEHSLALMDEMRSSGLEPGEGCHVMALKACATAGLWEKSLEMLRDMKTSGVNRPESSFVVAMKACGDAGQLGEALALMDDMRGDGVVPLETTYTTAMKACGVAGEWKQALLLFNEMRGMGIPPTELCFTAVIRACAKAHETGEAMSLLQEMRAAQGVPTNMASYRAIISAYCRAGDWAPATGLLEDARKEQLKPDTGDLRMLVQVCGESGQHERALSLLEEMRSEGMGMRRTGERLWWVFKECRNKHVKDRAWSLMEVEETRERISIRAQRNAEKAVSAGAAIAAAGGATPPDTSVDVSEKRQ